MDRIHRSSSSCSRQSYRDYHRRVSRRALPSSSSLSSIRTLISNSTGISPSVPRSIRLQSIWSHYDNNLNVSPQHYRSKWTVVRRRLPEILAMSETYKPVSLRGQLLFLMTMMNRQSSTDGNVGHPWTNSNQHIDFSHFWPANVSIKYGGRTQSVCLKRIPSEQWILVDVDGLSFSIPTRQFIFAISNDGSRDVVAQYCPPAISEMLIELSKTKIIDDRKQFERAQLKMRLVQSLFFITFVCICLMLLILIISVTKGVIAIKEFKDPCKNKCKFYGNTSNMTEKWGSKTSFMTINDMMGE